MTKYLIASFLLIASYSFSQEKNIEFFINDEHHKPIENVYVIIAGKPTTLSNKEGKITLNKDCVIKLQHLSYEMKEIDTKNIEGKSITMTNHIHQLQEVSVLPASTLEHILKECFKRLYANYATGYLQYLKINHYATSQDKTVMLLDGNLKINLNSYKSFNHYNDIFVDQYTQLNRAYFEKKHSLEHNYFISPGEVLDYLDFSEFDFLTNIKKYDYFLQSNDSQEYEILFSPKQERKFSYSGKMIINKNDYGIRLIDMALVSNNKNIRTTVISNFKPVDKYSFSEEKIQISFQKKEKKYYLASAFYVASMLQLKTSKIEQPKSFFTQTILIADDGKYFGIAKEISLSDLTLIDTSLQKTEKQLNNSEKKLKEKVEKHIKDNEQD